VLKFGGRQSPSTRAGTTVDVSPLKLGGLRQRVAVDAAGLSAVSASGVSLVVFAHV
jgi:hypothetical protein